MQDLKVPADYSPERDGTALCFFGDDPCFPCHPTGETWNGFDNVRVSPEVRDVIVQAWRTGPFPNEENIADLAGQQADGDGLIDLSNGWATELDSCNLQAALDAGFRFVPFNHGVIRTVWGDERVLVNDKGEETSIELAADRSRYTVTLNGETHTAKSCRDMHEKVQPLGWTPKPTPTIKQGN